MEKNKLQYESDAPGSGKSVNEKTEEGKTVSRENVSKGTVAAITVTYNRTRTLEKCIGALLNQTRPVDYIIIADNHSNAEEQEKIRKIAEKSDKIKILFLDENKGGAGGFEAGMREAQKLSPDWYWLMDDDAYPRRDCLETLLNKGKELPDVGGLCPLIYGIDLKHYQLFHHKKLSRFMMKNSPVIRDEGQLQAVTKEEANADRKSVV